jgi:hypothetical protein
LCDIANQDWWHGGSLEDGWQTSFVHWIYHDRSASDKHVQNGADSVQARWLATGQTAL